MLVISLILQSDNKIQSQGTFRDREADLENFR